MHRSGADLVASRRATPERVATHLLLSEPAGDPFVVATLREAAARSLAQGVTDVATSYLRRALEEPPPEPSAQRLLYELGRWSSGRRRRRGRASAPGGRPVRTLCSARGPRSSTVARCGSRRAPRAIEVFQSAIASLGDEQRELRERLEAEPSARPGGAGVPADRDRAPAADQGRRARRRTRQRDAAREPRLHRRPSRLRSRGLARILAERARGRRVAAQQRGRDCSTPRSRS